MPDSTTASYVDAVNWRDTAPRSLLDAGLCARGEPDLTPLDRRWLWWLENFLAVSGTTSGHHEMGRQLRNYLNETCEHHWHSYEAGDGIPAHRQCAWCSVAEWSS